ncbi:MAG: hypothetical protein RMX35_03415 [Nostoc sp. DcaGUA01]|nr:hypothetical protein [Nostoc sp. DcaGUA01]
MSEEQIEIYEFRRGFTYKLQGESWVSTGFYGPKYVGITFKDNEIPEAIIQAIQEQAFDGNQFVDIHRMPILSSEEYGAIGTQRFNEEFTSGIALVGRIIDDWSVLAVITFALDFSSRIFPVQRYFCCQESPDYDAMATLIAWWSANKITFDISDNDPGQVYNFSPIKSEDLPNVNNLDGVRPTGYPHLYLLQPGIDNSLNKLLQIWSTCLQLANQNQINPAWAFNIHSLKRPELFTLIQAATEEYYHNNISEENIVNFPQTHEDTPQKIEIIPNKITLKSALINFKNNGTLTLENQKILKQAIINNYNYQSWQNLFEPIFNDCAEEKNIIYLLTLQSIIIPEKTLDLLQQLVYSNENLWDNFISCQTYLRTILKPEINQSLEEGVWYVINSLVENKISLPFSNKVLIKIFSTGLIIDKFFNQQIMWANALSKSLEQYLIINFSSSEEDNLNPIENLSRTKFFNNLKQVNYRKRYNQGYQLVIKIMQRSQLPKISIIKAEIYNNINGNIPAQLYNQISTNYIKNYPGFVSSLKRKPTLKDKFNRFKPRQINERRQQVQVRYLQAQPSKNKVRQQVTSNPRRKIRQDNTVLEFITVIALIAFILLLIIYLIYYFIYQINIDDPVFIILCFLCILSLVALTICIISSLILNRNRNR